MPDLSSFDNLVKRLAAAASSTGFLSVDKMNQLLPPGFDVELIDEIFDRLWRLRITVVDEIPDRQRDSGKTGDAPAEKLSGIPESSSSSPASSCSAESQSEMTAQEEIEFLCSPSRVYMGEIQDIGYVTREEEDLLARRARSGDRQATERLVEAFMPLVARLARRYRRSAVPFIELVLAGNEGLVEAVRHYQARPGRSFAGSAAWWIRQKICKCIADNWQASKIPKRVSRRLKRMAGITARYRSKRGRDPSPEFLARFLRLDIDEVYLLKGLFSSPVSMYAPVGGEGEGVTVADHIPDVNALEGESEAERKLLRQRLDSMLDKLDLLEREILVLRFGLRDQVARSFEEISSLTGISRAVVEQLAKAGLRKLRKIDSPAF